MAKVLIVPDTHGRDFWKEAKNLIDNYDKVIFLGDYVDPYPHEFKLTRLALTEKVIEDFEDIISFAKQYPEKVILLDGNHLLHYVDTTYACSRFDGAIHSIIEFLYDDNHELFHHCYRIDDVLFTHAGVSKEWVDYLHQNEYLEYDGDPVKFINECSMDQLMMCGGYRGGWDAYSGPEWLDIDELRYLTPLPGFFQIFGHSQVGYTGGPVVTDSYAGVDTQTLYEFDTETRVLTMLQELPPCRY
jgi:hypothetical protein